MNILFLTTANLSSNPRLLKEVQLASLKSFEITIFAFWQGNWSDQNEFNLLNQFKNVKYIYLHATQKKYLNWLIVSIIEKVCKYLYFLGPNSLLINACASSKRSIQLIQALKRKHPEADMIIGHNMGSLYPAYWYSRNKKKPFVFDIEDFHPGETIISDVQNEIKRRYFLFNKLLPKAGLISYASPLIGHYALKELKMEGILINNSFHSGEFIKPEEKNDGQLNLVWFSQNISYGRGLEILIEAIDQSNISLNLTLIGQCNNNFYADYLESRKYIRIINPLSSTALHKELANHDIGLSLEMNNADFNRQICWTNKIFAYAQAGLYIMATNTPGQTLFMEKYPGYGCTCNQNAEDISAKIIELNNQIRIIRNEAKSRYVKAKEFAWEAEKNKLLTAWSSIKM